jgi:hypothetical protein
MGVRNRTAHAWASKDQLAFLTLIFAVVFFWFVLAYYWEIVDTDELSFTMLTVHLRLVYWIGPIGALQFLLTAIVLFIRFWREPLPMSDDKPAAGGHLQAGATPHIDRAADERRPSAVSGFSSHPCWRCSPPA